MSIRRCEHCGGHTRKGWENRLGLFTRFGGTEHFVHMGCYRQWAEGLPGDAEPNGVCTVCGGVGTESNPLGVCQHGSVVGAVGHVLCLMGLLEREGGDDGES
jgi:hypothetical protein